MSEVTDLADFPYQLYSVVQRLLTLRPEWVRSRVHINLSFGFSRAVGSASDTSNDKVLYQPIPLVAEQSDFKERVVKKMRQLCHAVLCVCFAELRR